MKAKQSVRVVNKLSGEVFELEFSTLEEAEQAYLIVAGLEAAMKRAAIKIKAFIDQQLGDEEKYDFGDGYIAQRIAGSRKSYPKSLVAQYLDEDQLDLVLEVNGRKLKDLFKQLVEDGQAPEGAWKAIDAGAELTPVKPYIKIVKA